MARRDPVGLQQLAPAPRGFRQENHASRRGAPSSKRGPDLRARGYTPPQQKRSLEVETGSGCGHCVWFGRQRARSLLENLGRLFFAGNSAVWGFEAGMREMFASQTQRLSSIMVLEDELSSLVKEESRRSRGGGLSMCCKPFFGRSPPSEVQQPPRHSRFRREVTPWYPLSQHPK